MAPAELVRVVPGVVLPRSPDNVAIRPGGHMRLLVHLTWAGPWEEQFHTSWKEAWVECCPRGWGDRA